MTTTTTTTFASNAAAVRASEGRKVSTANSKMPGSSFATDPFACNVGGKLAKVEGSVCGVCYAKRLAAFRPSVAKGYALNEAALRGVSEAGGRSQELFVSGMAFQIRKAADKTGQPYHRWFDAGDLPSVEALRTIVLVCEATPDIHHWLPTRELKVVRDYARSYGALPSNLVVRVSSTMVGDSPRSGCANTSTVAFIHTRVAYGHVCPATSQGNNCGDCRACWSPEVANVSYPVH